MLAAIIYGLSVPVVLLILIFELRKWFVNKLATKFSTLKEWPIVGIGGRFFGKDNEDVMSTLNELFYEAKTTPFRAWLGPDLVVGLDEPDDIQAVLNADECLNKPYMYDNLWNKTGLFTSRDETWKSHRKALNPTFNPKILIGFVPTINAKAKILTDQLNVQVGHSIDIYRPLFKCFTDILVNTAFDTNMDMQGEEGDRIHDLFIGLMDSFQRRMVRFWLRWDFVYKLTAAYKAEMKMLMEGHAFLRKITNNKAIELSEKLRQGEDILQINKDTKTLNWIQKCFLLMREGKFTDDNIFDQIVTLFVGGTDTSSVTIMSTLIMLAIHPEKQEKVVDELRTIFDGSVDKEITYDDIRKMTYMEMVIKETLRHFSVGPYIGRKCNANFRLNRGTIPKGSFIIINAQKLHKNPKIWGENVNRFYPEYFLPEHVSKMHPYSYIPFSAGPRNCVGRKYAWVTVKLVLAYLLRRYRFTTNLKLEDVRTKIFMILKIANENPVQFEPRDF